MVQCNENETKEKKKGRISKYNESSPIIHKYANVEGTFVFFGPMAKHETSEGKCYNWRQCVPGNPEHDIICFKDSGPGPWKGNLIRESCLALLHFVYLLSI